MTLEALLLLAILIVLLFESFILTSIADNIEKYLKQFGEKQDD